MGFRESAPVLKKMVERLISIGPLVFIWPDGTSTVFGRPPEDRAPFDIVVRYRDWLTPWKVVLYPELCFGEGYMNGGLVFERGTLAEFFDLWVRNVRARDKPPGWIMRARMGLMRRWQQANDQRSARRNVAHHYDLSDTLYRQFLDKDRQYSCAYFPHAGISIEEAQTAKKRHIASKLLLKPGQHVLDIGCGWGGMALHLARAANVRVTGITLSEEQLAVARSRAAEAGLSERVQFELCDYRDVEGPFDRIVSVGMFEHVGEPNYDTYFQRIRDLLAPDGVALVHSIGRSDGPGLTNPWIRKYIFPGGYVPALSQVLPAVERSGLYATDIEILRLHYAETLAAWRRRFIEREALVRQIYDERFCRMWDFYLSASEAAFRYNHQMVFQIQLSPSLTAVPLTRDYMFETERQTETAGR
jgi:cyclopropane-fatty-acyl-phospholipid synthase